MKTKTPTNLNSVLHSYANLYARLGDEEMTIERADSMERKLDGMLRVYGHAYKEDELRFRIAQSGMTVKRLIEMQSFKELGDSPQEET